MIGSILACFLAVNQDKPTTLAAAMHEANTYYNAAEPYPIQDPGYSITEALDGYRDALKRFGHVPSARLGVARCLFHRGNYADAAHQFGLLGSQYTADVSEARSRATVAEVVDRRLAGTRVIQIIPIPNTKNWLAVVGKRVPLEYWRDRQFEEARLVLLTVSSDQILKFLGERRLGAVRHPGMGTVSGYSDRFSAGSVNLYLMKSASNAKSWTAAVYRNYPAADCYPCSIETCEVSASGLGESGAFGSLTYDTSIRPATKKHGILITAAPTFKVWWSDTYELRNGKFYFANHAHPELYKSGEYAWKDADSDHYYPSWMIRAAIYDIQGQYKKALAAWKRAEWACLNTLRYDHGGNYEFHDSGFLGEARVNLGEIRQRIRWLRKRDYGHKLLYRPYDFDLQVPPYRIGKARGSSET